MGTEWLYNRIMFNIRSYQLAETRREKARYLAMANWYRRFWYYVVVCGREVTEF